MVQWLAYFAATLEDLGSIPNQQAWMYYFLSFFVSFLQNFIKNSKKKAAFMLWKVRKKPS